VFDVRDAKWGAFVRNGLARTRAQVPSKLMTRVRFPSPAPSFQ
jgi:hypothetical protein